MKKNRKEKLSLLLGTLCLFLFFPDLQKNAAAQSDQSNQQAAPEKSEESSDQPDKSDQSEPRRIVDPNKFPPKSSLPARILLAPFRAIEPKANGVVTYFEKKYFDPGRVKSNKPTYIRPLIGGLGDGSGIGGGVYLSTADLISKDFNLFTSLQVTSKRYLETKFGFRADPTGGSQRVFSIDLISRYRLRPEEDFWGLGPQSLRSQRSTYYLQERGVGLTASVRLPLRFRLGLGIDYSSNRVFPGTEDRFPSTQKLFLSSNLPGLVEGGAALLGTTIFAEFDGRDEPGNPHKGAYARFAVTSNDSVGRGDFGYVNYLLDARGYIPLWNDRHVLALRLLGNFNDPKGGSQIPFFRLARLGDQDTLRGYGTYRFHARNALASNIEYRYQIGRWLDALAFTDIGQVFDHLSQLKTENTHVTFGGGIQLRSEKKVILKLLVGKSGEETRIFFSFGPTF